MDPRVELYRTAADYLELKHTWVHWKPQVFWIGDSDRICRTSSDFCGYSILEIIERLKLRGYQHFVIAD